MFSVDSLAPRRLRNLRTNLGGLMIPQLERRLGKLEAKLKPRALRAIIDAFLDWSALADSGYVSRPLPPDDPRLHQGVDERGDAVISRWWSVSFFEGTRGLVFRRDARAAGSPAQRIEARPPILQTVERTRATFETCPAIAPRLPGAGSRAC